MTTVELHIAHGHKVNTLTLKNAEIDPLWELVRGRRREYTVGGLSLLRIKGWIRIQEQNQTLALFRAKWVVLILRADKTNSDQNFVVSVPAAPGLQ